jgi:hypothetical protein
VVVKENVGINTEVTESADATEKRCEVKRLENVCLAGEKIS